MRKPIALISLLNRFPNSENNQMIKYLKVNNVMAQRKYKVVSICCAWLSLPSLPNSFSNNLKAKCLCLVLHTNYNDGTFHHDDKTYQMLQKKFQIQMVSESILFWINFQRCRNNISCLFHEKARLESQCIEIRGSRWFRSCNSVTQNPPIPTGNLPKLPKQNKNSQNAR